MRTRVTATNMNAARDMAKRAALSLAPHDGSLVHGIEEILQRAASEERNTHAYRNQTGHLQQSTRAQVVSESDDEFRARIEMGEEYASYVEARGYSNFRSIVSKAATEIAAHVANVSKRNLT